MSQYILTIDQGTTSSRVVIFDERGNIIVKVQKEFKQILPEPGYVLHDASLIYEDVLELIVEALQSVNISYQDIKGVGITNQRETTVVWSKKTQEPICEAIVWQSTQTKAICDSLIEAGYSELVKEKTGLIINPYFSGTKIKWILDHIPGARKQMEDGDLLFGTIDSWLIYKLTGGIHVTDYTNASRTMLFNINTLEWDQSLLDMLGINQNMLPRVVSNSEMIGYVKEPRIKQFGDFPICGVAGDQQASLIGHCCFKEGSMKITYGTGSFMLVNTGSSKAISKHGLLSTIAYVIDGHPTYALEGSVFVAGSAFSFIKNNLEIVKDLSDDSFASLDSHGVYFVPALTGLGAPYWNANCKGAIFGLTRGTTKEDIAWATIEAVSYLNKDVLLAMEDDTNLSINMISVDGGASLNSHLMQFQADSTTCVVKTLSTSEATSLGVFYLAGLACHMFKDVKEIGCLYKSIKQFVPKPMNEKMKEGYLNWQKAVNACLKF